jgi:hypothetical protein
VLARTLKCPPCKGREITPYVDPESGKEEEEEPVMTATRLFLPVALLLMQAVAKPTLRPLVDFAGPEAAQQWQAVNDGVMGGVSDGRFRITPENTLEFFGTLSTQRAVEPPFRTGLPCRRPKTSGRRWLSRSRTSSPHRSAIGSKVWGRSCRMK